MKNLVKNPGALLKSGLLQKDWFRALSTSVLLSGTNSLFSLVRTREIAKTSGPAALGLLSQTLQFQLLLTTTGLLALWAPLVRELTNASGADERSELYRTSVTMQLTAVTLLDAALAAVWPWVAPYFLGVPAAESGTILAFLLVSSPVLVLAHGVLQAALHKEGAFAKQQFLGSAGALICAALSWPLIREFQLHGALAVLFLQGILLFFLYAIAIARESYAHELIAGVFRRAKALELLRSAKFYFLVYLAQSLAALLVRQHVIASEGLSANGLLQAVTTLSNLTLPIWATLLWGRVYPSLCSLPNARGDWRKPFERLLLLHFAMLVFLVLSGKYMIVWLLGESFEEASAWILPQILADHFTIVFLAHCVAWSARGRETRFLAAQTAALAAWWILSIAFKPWFGTGAVPWAALVINGLFALASEFAAAPDERWLGARPRWFLIAAWFAAVAYAFTTRG